MARAPKRTISWSAAGQACIDLVDNGAAITSDGSCTVLDPPANHHAQCPDSGVVSLTIFLEDLDDRFAIGDGAYPPPSLLGGEMRVDGGDGADRLTGAGAATRSRRCGQRRPTAGAGADALSGGAGDDVVDAGPDDDDVVNGDEGNDVVLGGAGSEIVSAQQGDDTVDGGAGDDEVMGAEAVTIGSSEATATTGWIRSIPTATSTPVATVSTAVQVTIC